MDATFSPVLAIHGGAGVMRGHDYSIPARHMLEILAEGGARLREGQSALELVVEMVAAMEASGLYVAGQGSAVNQAGEVELDASVMTGHDREAGEVAAVRSVLSPVRLARAVMSETPHVSLAGAGAEAFAERLGFDRVSDPQTYYRASTEITRKSAAPDESGALAHGTVGAVALDRSGHLAAATSTGGTLKKQQGRVGDTPIIGAGTWADDRVAVSCTGVGEYFMRTVAAYDVAARMAYQGCGIEAAGGAAIAAVGDLGGDGGLIAVDRKGRLAMPFNSGGMKRGFVTLEGSPVVEVY